MVICQGCGQAFAVPDGYGRNKIQCPVCGVICPVPAGAEASGGAPPRNVSPPMEEEAAAWLRDPKPPTEREAPSPFDEPSLREEPRASEPVVRKSAEMLFPCRRCGRLIRKQRECPSCDGAPEGAAPESPVGIAPHSLELDPPPPPAPILYEEDDSPYLLADKDLPRCPKCNKEMPEGAVLCAACGFNLRTRKKAARTYEPMARSWETNMSLRTRLLWLAAGEGLHFVFATVLVLAGSSAWPFFVSWPLLTVLLCFVLGTYARIDLVRDTRGRVRVAIQWRAFFVPLPPQKTEVRGFEGVTTGEWHDAGFLEWFVLFSLLPWGLLPGIIWWYNTMHKEHFHVALARDHGHADVYVYRGRSQEQMHDISEALCNAAGLRNVN
jgi:hypothetical protein